MAAMRKSFGLLIAVLLLLAFNNCNRDNVSPKDPKGKIKKYKYLTFTGPDGVTTSIANGSGNYFYDGNLNLKEFKWFSNDNPERISYENHYAFKNSNVISESTYKDHLAGEPLILIAKNEYFYGTDNLLDSLLLFNASNTNNTEIKFLQATYYFYYADGRLISSRFKNATNFFSINEGFQFKEYQYDKAGNLSAILIKYSDGNGTIKDQFRYEYTYDNKPNPFKGLVAHFPDQWYLHWYLSPNNVTSITSYSFINSTNGTKSYETQYEYEYDNEGRPVQETIKTLVEDDDPTNKVMVNSIEYY